MEEVHWQWLNCVRLVSNVAAMAGTQARGICESLEFFSLILIKSLLMIRVPNITLFLFFSSALNLVGLCHRACCASLRHKVSMRLPLECRSSSGATTATASDALRSNYTLWFVFTCFIAHPVRAVTSHHYLVYSITT